jgi:hypothetical protein
MFRILAAVFVFALFVGCVDNYEMKEAGGKLYRLNKRTGDVDLVQGRALIRLQKGALPANSCTPADKGSPSESGAARRIPGAPPAGTVQDGYRFVGGDPADSTQWEPVRGILDTMRWKPGEKRMIGKYPVRKLQPWHAAMVNRKKVFNEKTGKYDSYYLDPETGEWERDQATGAMR